MRYLLIVGPLLAVLLLAAVPGSAQENYTGVWNGSTDQALRLTMVIEGRTVQSVYVNARIRGGPPDWCAGDVTVNFNNPTGLYYINDNMIDLFWEQEGKQLQLFGVLSGDYVTGNLRVTTTETHTGQCVGTGGAAWEAHNRNSYNGDRPNPDGPGQPGDPSQPGQPGQPGDPGQPVGTPRPTRTPLPAPDPGTGENCSPSYPDVCIPPPPPDKNCPEIREQYGCDIRVTGADPHDLDRDDNGIGCECQSP